jgi:hypothetical protein
MNTPYLRGDIDWEGMPAHMKGLPIDHRGYPVPYFVAWDDDKKIWEFRATDERKWVTAATQSRCWICGQHVGVHKTFVIGPMCGVNRNTAEPGSHAECALWAVKNCPFLVRPNMVRREDEDLIAKSHAKGIMITRNPEVTLLWCTKSWRVHLDMNNSPMIRLGDPETVSFWKEGRTATREEILTSIRTGLPAIEEHITENYERRMLQQSLDYMMTLIPKENAHGQETSAPTTP